MRKIALLCLAAFVACSSTIAADETFQGTLDSSQVWDRVFGIPLTDSSNNDTPYEIFRFTFDADDSDVNFEVLTFAPGDDTTMYFFQNIWDVNDPLGATNTANALVYDDDGGTGFLSAMGSDFGDANIAVTAGQVYGLIISGFNSGDEGTFQVQIRTAANVVAVPEPTTASLSILSLCLVGCARRRRK